MKYCACEKEEACLMESCAVCLTAYEKSEGIINCNTVALGFSEEQKELAKKALKSCKDRKGENIEEWAKKLASDVCNAND